MAEVAGTVVGGEVDTFYSDKGDVPWSDRKCECDLYHELAVVSILLVCHSHKGGEPDSSIGDGHAAYFAWLGGVGVKRHVGGCIAAVAIVLPFFWGVFVQPENECDDLIEL